MVGPGSPANLPNFSILATRSRGFDPEDDDSSSRVRRDYKLQMEGSARTNAWEIESLYTRRTLSKSRRC